MLGNRSFLKTCCMSNLGWPRNGASLASAGLLAAVLVMGVAAWVGVKEIATSKIRRRMEANN